MKILGLTGSIGMGKSTTAAMFRRCGVPVFDADRAVHRLLSRGGGGYDAVAGAFPDAAGPAGIDRHTLGALVFGEQAAIQRLEAILHPMVQQVRQQWIARQRRLRRALVVLDVPLLYETGGDAQCDAVIVVSAPALLQRQRVMRRPGMSAEKFAAIRSRQVPDHVKRRRADWIVPTGLGRRAALDGVKRIIAAYRGNSRTCHHA